MKHYPSDTFWNISYENNIEAGTATVTLTAKSTGNYTGSVKKTFTIDKQAVTADLIAPDALTYGDALPQTADYTFTNVTGLRGDDATNGLTTVEGWNLTIDYQKAGESVTAKNADTYDIVATATSKNYDITINTTGINLTINKKQLDVKADDKAINHWCSHVHMLAW